MTTRPRSDYAAFVEGRMRRDYSSLGPLPARLLNAAMGLAGEAGETCDYIKKVVFHEKVADVNKILSEAGDVLFYLTALLNEYGLDLEDAIEYNVNKLTERYPDGVFKKEHAEQRRDER